MKIERMGNEFVLCSGTPPIGYNVAFIHREYALDFLEALETHTRAGSWTPAGETKVYMDRSPNSWWVLRKADYNQATFSEKNEFGVVCP